MHKRKEHMGVDLIREKVQDFLAIVIPIVLINVIMLILIAIGSNLAGMGSVIEVELSKTWGSTLATTILVAVFVSGGLALMLKMLSKRMRIFNWKAINKGAFTCIWVGITAFGSFLAFWIKIIGSVSGEIWELWVKTFTALPTILIVCALNIAIFIVIFVWTCAARNKVRDQDKDVT